VAFGKKKEEQKEPKVVTGQALDNFFLASLSIAAL
jgi:hypothetical protein